MKGLRRFFWVAVFIPGLLVAQTRFQRTAGTKGDERNYHLTKTRDGGMVATGYTDAVGSAGDEAFLVKYNKFGKVVWSQTYGDTGDDYSWDVIETSNGDLIGAGYTTSFGTAANAATLSRTDSAGGIKWVTAVYTLADGVDFYRAIETSTGHLLATGLMQSSSNKDEIVLAKFTSKGALVWIRTLGSASADEAMGLIETSQGHYLLAGLTASTTGNGKNDFVAAKIDTAGNLIWSYSYGGSNSERLNSCIEHDNNYYFVGWSGSFGEGGNDVVLMETDTAGKVNWVKSYGSNRNELAFNMVYDPLDRSLVIAGYTERFSSSTSNDNRNTFLLKTSITGKMKWAESYGSSKYDGHWPTGLVINDDMGYYVLGSSNSYGVGGYDLYLTKADTSGDACNVRTPGFKEGSATWKASSFGTLKTPTVTTTTSTTISGASWQLSQKMQCCALYVDAGRGDTLCSGDTAFLGSPAIRGYKYQWLKGGTAVSNQAQIDVTYGKGGSYTLVANVTGSGCSTAVDGALVVDDKQPIMMPYGEARFCEGDTFNAVLSGDFASAQWTSQTSNTRNDTGRYYQASVSDSVFISVQTDFGCKYFDTVKFSAIKYPNVIIGDSMMFCEGDSIDISAQSDHEWNWKDTTLKDSMIWVQQVGWYVAVSSNLQCVSEDSVWVGEKPLPAISFPSDTTVCPGNVHCFKPLKTVDIELFEWNNTVIADSFCTADDTVITLTAIGFNGCKGKQNIDVKYFKVTTEIFEQDTIKGSGAVTLDVGNGWAAQRWENGDTTKTLLATTDGKYRVTAKDQNGCWVTDSVEVLTGVGTRAVIVVEPLVFPNPFKDQLSIRAKDAASIELRLVDVSGKVVLGSRSERSEVTIETVHLSKGIYYLEVYTAIGQKSTQLVVKQ